MVRTHSRQQAGVPHVTRQPLRHLLQERVAGRPTEAVVDVLEPLQIEQVQGKLVPAADSAARILRQPLEKQAAVRESGERIVVSEVVELFLIFDVIQRKPDVAGQLRQKFHLFFIEKPGFIGVQGEYAYHVIRDQQRQNSHRGNSAFDALLGEQDPWIVSYFVGYDGLLFPDCTRGHGVAQRRICAQ